MKSPMAISTTETRNGTRHPQARNSLSGSQDENAANTPVESRSPAGEPI